MANSPSARKRIRQNEDRRLRNKSRKSELKTLTKRFLERVENKDRDGAQTVFRTLVAKLDRAGVRRLYHPNKVARYKSRLSRILNQLG